MRITRKSSDNSDKKN